MSVMDLAGFLRMLSESESEDNGDSEHNCDNPDCPRNAKSEEPTQESLEEAQLRWRAEKAGEEIKKRILLGDIDQRVVVGTFVRVKKHSGFSVPTKENPGIVLEFKDGQRLPARYEAPELILADTLVMVFHTRSEGCGNFWIPKNALQAMTEEELANFSDEQKTNMREAANAYSEISNERFTKGMLLEYRPLMRYTNDYVRTPFLFIRYELSRGQQKSFGSSFYDEPYDCVIGFQKRGGGYIEIRARSWCLKPYTPKTEVPKVCEVAEKSDDKPGDSN